MLFAALVLLIEIEIIAVYVLSHCVRNHPLNGLLLFTASGIRLMKWTGTALPVWFMCGKKFARNAFLYCLDIAIGPGSGNETADPGLVLD